MRFPLRLIRYTSTVAKGAGASPLPKSIVPPGTVLKGINYLKEARDPIVLEDAEYPDWVWKLAESEPTPRQAERQVKKAKMRLNNFAKAKG